MTDVIDRANELAERERASALEAARARTDAAPSGAMWCEECEALIPERRRQAVPSARMCVDCETAAEMRGRHFAR
ncbi:TraR/DksA C4-type zinc finger protein [Algiphilus sp.]|uniref:TraR/DksA C4-type zinc finger protein n=1 Tax=Algiphilus sp. TaxID=1872431 RepID=UPI0025BF462A|nr:TraR/DksA C4-type zinc finger protein [Algiphilus sp.]MCK5769488.1 TraR/DksA C4-type zinc finger protein [Algiphilus sp.]